MKNQEKEDLKNITNNLFQHSNRNLCNINPSTQNLNDLPQQFQPNGSDVNIPPPIQASILVEELQKENNELKVQLQEQENNYKWKMENEQNKMQTTLDRQDRIIQGLKKETFALKSQISSAEKTVYFKQQTIDIITKERRNIQKQNEVLQDQLDTTKNQLNLQILKTMANANSGSSLQFDESIIQEYENQIKKGKEDIRKIKEDLNNQIQTLKDKLDNTEQKLENSIKQCDKEHQQFIEARDEIAKLQRVIEEKDEKIKYQDNKKKNLINLKQLHRKYRQEIEREKKRKGYEALLLRLEWELEQNRQREEQQRLCEAQQASYYCLNDGDYHPNAWLKSFKSYEEENPREKDVDMEALCKKGKFFQFEEQPDVKTVILKLQVWKVEIKEEEFNNKIETIEEINCPQDFTKTLEGTWHCMVTEKPYAFSKMMELFLMKKLNTDELYVIKTPIDSKPYQTINHALQICKSHLISQKLMKKFISELQEQQNLKGKTIEIPPVIYSDIFILQDSEDSFWIAERLYNGQFNKYNDNFGFIHEDHQLQLNKFAQSFTYYTYFTSNFNYMVTNVQGVGNYFTDPNINTIKGNFDDSDMGCEGQMMYLVNYENKKAELTYEYLDLLEIYG